MENPHMCLTPCDCDYKFLLEWLIKHMRYVDAYNLLYDEQEEMPYGIKDLIERIHFGKES